MGITAISGEARITSEGIRKHFKNTEPYRALVELIWNGFDARAQTVNVVLEETPIGGLVDAWVLDNGDGIDYDRIENNFGRFNDSAKKEDFVQHGCHGRGRLAFHRLAQRADWHTKRGDQSAVISVLANDLKNWQLVKSDDGTCDSRLANLPSGTLVVLSQFTENLPDQKDLQGLLSNEFGWFLALNPDKELTINGAPIPVPAHELAEDKIVIGEDAFEVRVICWEEKPGSEKSYVYLLNSTGQRVHQYLSSLNKKPDFHLSVFVQSIWADTFDPVGGLLAKSPNTPESETWRTLTKKLSIVTREIYDNFLKRHAEKQIQKYEEEGVFPSYAGLPREYATWRLSNVKGLVQTIYQADPGIFNSLKARQKKVVIGLLDRLAVSNENDALYDVLSGVLDMDDESVASLASQLKRTTLENIVSTIELLQRRQHAIHELRELMNSHYNEVRETPDLQQIIENNTWLFGPNYETLGAEEDTFTNIAKALRNSVPEIDAVTNDDLEGDSKIDGALRQVDLFLARKVPSFDSLGNRYYRCVIVEIKRPSVSLNVKHLRQLDDYAAIIKKHAEFTSELSHFELILIGRKISNSDTEIRSRLEQQISKGEVGLVTADTRMKRYVLNWYTLLENFELTNEALLNRLKLKRDSVSSTAVELIENLQQPADSTVH